MGNIRLIRPKNSLVRFQPRTYNPFWAWIEIFLACSFKPINRFWVIIDCSPSASALTAPLLQNTHLSPIFNPCAIFVIPICFRLFLPIYDRFHAFLNPHTRRDMFSTPQMLFFWQSGCVSNPLGHAFDRKYSLSTTWISRLGLGTHLRSFVNCTCI